MKGGKETSLESPAGDLIQNIPGGSGQGQISVWPAAETGISVEEGF